ncbi:glycosyltransferase family 10 domain-containing protein [Parvularcula sp. IMCC14364]|uniref:glycosyltransferase family 10 domain-containing protein n=1 Tax=Parvularcula sp. IMCC14364 TaxID=3067902 RepID=UPI00274114CB|nr:glycosyltransferase family 10 [Parvularcula sp. IMCC14364]
MTQDKRIKVKFTDVWNGFNANGYPLWQHLQKNFPVELSDDPDFLIFSINGANHLNYTCEKIFITHEAAFPDFRWCDYAITFRPDINHPRHLQLQNFALRPGYQKIDQLVDRHRQDTAKILAEKNRFGAYLASNGNAKAREDIFDALSAYKKVDSGGKHRNNIGGPVPPNETWDFLRGAKFIIACENSLSPGYVTEKLGNAMLADAIPIYWGDEFVNELFNPARFINARNFSSLDDLCAHVQDLDQSDEKYLDVLRQPCLKNNQQHACLKQPYLLDFFADIFNGNRRELRRPDFEPAYYARQNGWHRRYMKGPMTLAELDILHAAREDYLKKGLLDTRFTKSMRQELEALADSAD